MLLLKSLPGKNLPGITYILSKVLPNLLSIVNPLNIPLRKGVSLMWGDKQWEAFDFDKSKALLTSADFWLILTQVCLSCWYVMPQIVEWGLFWHIIGQMGQDVLLLMLPDHCLKWKEINLSCKKRGFYWVCVECMY